MKDIIINSLIKNSVEINKECTESLNAVLNEMLKEKGLGTLENLNLYANDEISYDIIDLAYKITVLDNLKTILMAIKFKDKNNV